MELYLLIEILKKCPGYKIYEKLSDFRQKEQRVKFSSERKNNGHD
jgi:hypothetical protein